MIEFDFVLIVKLVISAVLGLVIGLERELKSKPLGLKTSLVISIISCLITIVSIESALTFPDSDYIRIQMDPLRLAAQIVSGVGFLGAGVILRRDNHNISGLTTAAIIWGAAGIGIAVGAGFYIEATVGVLLLLFSVELVPFLLVKFGPEKLRKREVLIKIKFEKQGSIKLLMQKLKKGQVIITHTQIKDVKEELTHSLELKALVYKNRSIEDVYYFMQSIDNVNSIEINN